MDWETEVDEGQIVSLFGQTQGNRQGSRESKESKESKESRESKESKEHKQNFVERLIGNDPAITHLTRSSIVRTGSTNDAIHVRVDMDLKNYLKKLVGSKEHPYWDTDSSVYRWVLSYVPQIVQVLFPSPENEQMMVEHKMKLHALQRIHNAQFCREVDEQLRDAVRTSNQIAKLDILTNLKRRIELEQDDYYRAQMNDILLSYL
ncbi:MAG: hypothetical protein ACREBW_08555 [Candidatus Micrarchaeaceae archaeon]